MDSFLPSLKPFHKETDARVPSSDSTCSKLPLIFQLDDEKSEKRQTWTRETKRPRLHPSYTKSNAKRKMDSVQISGELSPMPYQAQFFRSSTSLKMVPLKKYHNLPTFSQPLPEQVTKTKSVPFHSRNPLLLDDHSSSVLDWQGYYKTGDQDSDPELKKPEKIQSEYRDLHVGGKPSNLMEREDPLMWASRSNARLERKKKSSKPLLEMDTEERPTSESTLRQVSADAGAPKTDGSTFKSLSLEEMSIRKKMMRKKHISSKDGVPSLPEGLEERTNRNRMPPLKSEEFHQMKRMHPVPSKRAMVSREDKTMGQKSVKLGTDVHSGRNETTTERNVGRFQQGENRRDRRRYADGKKEKRKDIEEGHSCNHRGKGTETRKGEGKVKMETRRPEGRKRTETVKEEDRVKEETVQTNKEEMRMETITSPPSQESPPEPPENEPAVETEEVCDNDSESVSEIMETEAICSPNRPEEQVLPPESPNLFQMSSLKDYITEEKMKYLTKTFQKLDGDKDGHLKFRELEAELPRALSHGQKSFIKEVYEVVSLSTFFGLSEFCTVVLICECLLKLPPVPREAMELSHSGQESISSLMRLFNLSDVMQTCSISLQSLFDLLYVLGPQRMGKIRDDLHLGDEDTISKIDFICYIPYFLSLTETS